MKKEVAATLKLQGLFRGAAFREQFRRKGIHITSVLEEYARATLLPRLKADLKSDVAVCRTMDPIAKEEQIFVGMVNNSAKAHGWGCIIFPNMDSKSRAHYMGEFCDGLIHGVGVLTFQKGGRYQGQFERDMPHGYGMEYYPSGAIYQGQFKKDFRHGLGIYTYQSGLTYGGYWKHGNQHGEGVQTHLMRPNDLNIPNVDLWMVLNEIKAAQEDLMKQDKEFMMAAKDLEAKGDHAGAHKATQTSNDLILRAELLSNEMRRQIDSKYENTGRDLVCFNKGKKLPNKDWTKNAFATEIVKGSCVELNLNHGQDFVDIDRDNSGQISLAEVRDFMRSKDASVTEEEVLVFFNKLDLNKDKIVSTKEYVQAAIFSAMDADTSGDITLTEVRSFMQKEDRTVTEQQVQDRFHKMDMNHDGIVSKQEYISAEGFFDDFPDAAEG